MATLDKTAQSSYVGNWDIPVFSCVTRQDLQIVKFIFLKFPGSRVAITLGQRKDMIGWQEVPAEDLVGQS